MTTDDDDAVLSRMLDGDEEAFGQIYRSIQPGLLRYLTVLIGAGDAEDVASEAWAQAVRDLATFSGNSDKFRGWITRIARNRALDLARYRGRRPVVDVDDLELVQDGLVPGADAVVLDLDSTASALRLIASLPPDQAEAVLLRAVVGLDAVSAARVLDKRPGAVRVAAHRGLKALEKKLLATSNTEAPSNADEVT